MNPLNELKLVFRLIQLFGLILIGLFIYLGIGFIHPEWLESKPQDALAWKPRDVTTDLDGVEKAAFIKLGYDVITKTPELIGPLAANPRKQFAGNNLTCQSCHLEGGTKPGAGSFVGVYNRFPQFRGRENREGTLEDRIDGCMERSMNGEKMPHNSLEMQAMVAYMKWLSEDVPEDKQEIYKGFPKVNLPEVKADLSKGKAVFEQYCVVCHAANGQGIRPSKNSLYQFPPLWGEDTYNDGAGMHRVITAAEFIKGNMPFQQATYNKPVLTDEEAYNVAAYINSFARPQKANTDADFPDRKLKPVSTPYGPWADSFSTEQHKYGPFQPIMSFYLKEYGIKKSK